MDLGGNFLLDPFLFRLAKGSLINVKVNIMSLKYNGTECLRVYTNWDFLFR